MPRFNPRSPCGERRSARMGPCRSPGFNPRSPCGERLDDFFAASPISLSFNPRSPCGERRFSVLGWFNHWEFQPTLPLRGATWPWHCPARALPVSTHAPLAGSDARTDRCSERPSSFQPTLPLRGATRCGSGHSGALGFQPTLPLRGATWRYLECILVVGVSTHAPLAGSDGLLHGPLLAVVGFQPTLPLRGATWCPRNSPRSL